MTKIAATLNLRDLLDSTRENFPSRFASALSKLPKVPRVSYTVFPGFNMLAVRADIPSDSGRETYKVIIVFMDVMVSDKADKYHKISIKTSKGDQVYINQIGPGHRVQVSCSCMDFYFVASYWNRQAGVLYGRPRKRYIRVTTTMPERNPNHAMMLCKHLIALYFRLKRSPYSKGI